VNGAARILDALLDYGLLLTAAAGRLSVISPLGRPLPEALRAQIAVYRAEMVAELTWRGEALSLLTDCLARVERQYAPGCPLSDDELRQLEAEVTAAFWSRDHLRLQRSLRDYRLAYWTRFSAARGRGP
jgi:hypothetical protein